MWSSRENYVVSQATALLLDSLTCDRSYQMTTTEQPLKILFVLGLVRWMINFVL